MVTTHRPEEPRTAASDVRLVRAAAFASAGAALGSAGHVAACGSLAWGPVLAGWSFLFSVGSLAAGRRRGPVSIIGATALGQVLLVFKALQTYDDGTVVRWIDETRAGQPEPQHPAPVLTLTKASSSDADSHGMTAPAPAPAAKAEAKSADSAARTLGVVGIVVGVIGAGRGVLGLRRRPSA
ncbi:DUF1775 domain-containing protein [Kitasatospora sp. NPDC002227]|uniref:DUF1775 domain-containing protein n=1 Tax=Kitasatospora sp. NPDC002227 TaxID=3154773 RepID=UPI003329CCB9